jgi:hypothetical protein
VYDMYPWDSLGPGRRPPGTACSGGDFPSPRTTLAPRSRGSFPSPGAPLTRRSRGGLPSPGTARAAEAVQVALDRRDNGGDAADLPTADLSPAGPARQ